MSYYFAFKFNLKAITMTIALFFIFAFAILSSSSHLTHAQITSLNDSIKYQKQSNFIKEFEIPIQELGLKGITTDNKNNVWFYHSTNSTSSIFKFNQTTNEFKQYNVTADTVVDDFVTNLAGGQLVFDDKRNVIWFTDARTNSIGRLDVKDEEIQLFTIPTQTSGPMGITLSPDKENIWFTEILGNKIASLKINNDAGNNVNGSNNDDDNEVNDQIIEYPIYRYQQGQQQGSEENTGVEEKGGPTLLAFDDHGILWVTMSYSHDILRIEPWTLTSGSVYNAINYFTLPDNDTFSPFGIAIITTSNKDDNVKNINSNKDMKSNKTTDTNYNENVIGKESETERLFISDHGSSRVILSLGDPNVNPFQNYLSYWTSSSSAFPVSLPSQIVADSSEEDIYFAQHGGNKISKINLDSGIMTEYSIPTGPLSTTVFIAISKDNKKVWFTEYLSNKIAYLDTTIPVPYQMKIIMDNSKDSDRYSSNNSNDKYILFKNLPKIFEAVLINQNTTNNTMLNINDTNYSELLNNIELSITGITDSGVAGMQSVIETKEINLVENPISHSWIALINQTSISEKRMGENIRYDDKIALQQTNNTIMVRASTLEQDQSSISLLYPIILDFDIPISNMLPIGDSPENSRIANNISDIPSSQYEEDIFNISAETVRNILRTISLPLAIGLIGFIVYRRIREKRIKIKEKGGGQK